MFAHPWPNSVLQLRDHLSKCTAHHLRDLDAKRAQRGAPATVGRSTFDICLINRMTAASELKEDPTSRLKTTVSWHADSSLEHYSTIAVYQLILGDEKKGGKDKDSSSDWSVALRVAHNSEGPDCSSQRRGSLEDSVVRETPFLAVSLPSNSAYFLLDDFNHHHQHTVLTDANSASTRYSCTFRLLRESHNVSFLLERCRRTVSQFHKKGHKVYRSEQLLLTELESEWLRQFYIQGQQHRDLLWPTWGSSIEDLLRYWSQLERRTYQTEQLLRAAAEGVCRAKMDHPPANKAERKARDRQRKAMTTLKELLERESSSDVSLFDLLADLLEERADMRELWTKREKDYVFRDMDPEYRPLPVPFVFDAAVDDDNTMGTSPLLGSPVALRQRASDLRAFGRAYASENSGLLPKVAAPSVRKGPDADHAESLDWSGWSEFDFGLEMQSPWAQALIEGRKTIETRAYDLPDALLGKWIAIIQSPQGKPGISAMGNQLDFDSSDAIIVGWCKFSAVVQYTNRVDFESDEEAHLVASDSGFGWKEGRTKVIYGWVVIERKAAEKQAAEKYKTATRRMRSIYQMHTHSHSNDDPPPRNRNLEKNAMNQSDNGSKKKKRRKKSRNHLSPVLLSSCLLLSLFFVSGTQAFSQSQSPRTNSLIKYKRRFLCSVPASERRESSSDTDPVASGEALDALIPRSQVTQYYTTKSNLAGAGQVLYHLTALGLAAAIPRVSVFGGGLCLELFLLLLARVRTPHSLSLQVSEQGLCARGGLFDTTTSAALPLLPYTAPQVHWQPRVGLRTTVRFLVRLSNHRYGYVSILPFGDTVLAGCCHINLQSQHGTVSRNLPW